MRYSLISASKAHHSLYFYSFIKIEAIKEKKEQRGYSPYNTATTAPSDYRLIMDTTLKTVYSYSAPKEQLPAPLPSETEIRKATEEFKSNFHRIVRIGPYVVKHGTKADPTEAKNMLFVKGAAPGVPVPDVYAVYSIPRAATRRRPS